MSLAKEHEILPPKGTQIILFFPSPPPLGGSSPPPTCFPHTVKGKNGKIFDKFGIFAPSRDAFYHLDASHEFSGASTGG